MRRKSKGVPHFEPMLLKHMGQMLCVLICFFVVGYGLFWMRDPTHFPISSVSLVGDRQHVPLDVMTQRIIPQAELGFFRLEVSTLQQELLALPWMQDVSVRREWPDRVVIRYAENQPIARWGDEGLISLQGDLFFPEGGLHSFKSLPLLKGPPGKAWQVWRMYLNMEQRLARDELSIRTLELAPRGAWHVSLSNGLVIVLGTEHVLDKLNRFLLCYNSTLKSDSDAIAYADLRYSSGLALGWKHH